MRGSQVSTESSAPRGPHARPVRMHAAQRVSRASELSGPGTDGVIITFHLSRRSSGKGSGAWAVFHVALPSASVCGLTTALSPGPGSKHSAPPQADWAGPDPLPRGPAPLTPPPPGATAYPSVPLRIARSAPAECHPATLRKANAESSHTPASSSQGHDLGQGLRHL